MNELEDKIKKVVEVIIQALKSQKDKEGWSTLAIQKLNNASRLDSEDIKNNIRKLIEGENESIILDNSKRLISKLFSDKFLTSSSHSELIALIQSNLDNTSRSSHLSTGMILLDADQLSLDRDTEIQLEKRANCKILYRIAFANWKNKNNDRSLHERHYLLIHLPSGRDKADGGMMMFGSSVRHHYPDVNCLFICSNDKIFTSLAMRLTELNLQSYTVNQIGSEVHVKSLDGVESWKIQPLVPIAHLLERVKNIIRQKSNAWILISVIEESYVQEHGHSFKEDLQDRDKYNSLLEFLKHYPKHFVVHIVNEEELDIHVMLFQASDTLKGTNLDAKNISSEENKLDNTVEIFQQKIVKIIESLIQNSKSERPINLNELASAFFKTYQVPINKASMSATNQRFIDALSKQMLPQIQAKKEGIIWWISLHK